MEGKRKGKKGEKKERREKINGHCSQGSMIYQMTSNSNWLGILESCARHLRGAKDRTFILLWGERGGKKLYKLGHLWLEPQIFSQWFSSQKKRGKIF